MSSMRSPQQQSVSRSEDTPYENQLLAFCRASELRAPEFQFISDKRGGRTAWSCRVIIQGQLMQARFFYDGPNSDKAREDVAQVALERLGQIPPAGASPSQIQQFHQQRQQPQQASQQHSQPRQVQQPQHPQQPQRFYGAIGS